MADISMYRFLKFAHRAPNLRDHHGLITARGIALHDRPPEPSLLTRSEDAAWPFSDGASLARRPFEMVQ